MNFWKRFSQGGNRSPSAAWVDVLLPAVFSSPAAESRDVTRYSHASEWFVDAIVEISRLSDLPPNWDTYGSPAVTDAAKSRALRLLAKIGFPRLPTPDIGAVS